MQIRLCCPCLVNRVKGVKIILLNPVRIDTTFLYCLMPRPSELMVLTGPATLQNRLPLMVVGAVATGCMAIGGHHPAAGGGAAGRGYSPGEDELVQPGRMMLYREVSSVSVLQ